jgi:L-fuculose-phosphate aldolase
MSIKSRLADICHKVYDKGFVAGYDGNLSVRASDNSIYITPSAKCKGEVRETDILEIDLNGSLIAGNGKPSTESKIHLLAYIERADINAVIHCHPIYATAFASVGQSFDKPIFPEIILLYGKIPLCKYGTPSTQELPDSLLPHIKSSNILLLENHGAVSLGKSIDDAYYNMEKLEHMAHTLFVARTLGGEKQLSKENVEKLYSISEKTYGLSVNAKNKF